LFIDDIQKILLQEQANDNKVEVREEDDSSEYESELE